MGDKELTKLQGNAADDPIAAGIAAGLKDINGEIEGMNARLKVVEDQDLGKALGEVDTLKATVKGLQGLKDQIPADRWSELDEMGSRLDGLSAQIMSAAAAPGAAAAPKSIGDSIFEAEGFQQMLSKTPTQTRSHRVELGEHKKMGSVADILRGTSAVSDPVLGAADLGALRWSTRQMDVVRENKEPVAGFVPEIGVVPAPGFQVYEWQQETLDSYTGYVRTTLETALTGATTAVGTCKVNDGSHFVAGTYVRFFDADRNLLGRLLLASVTINAGAADDLNFTGTPIDWDQDAGTNITSEHWLGTDEGDSKPYTLLAGETTSVNATTIAIMAAVTRQQLLSPSGVQAWIEQELPDRSLRNIAYQMLYGAGPASGQLLGFWQYASAQTYLWSDGAVGDNRLDAIFKAELSIVGGAPTLVLNKRDMNELRLLKDTTEQYLYSMTLGKVSMEMMNGAWMLDGRIPVIVSDAVKDGDFLLADFATASKIIDAEDEALEYGVINDDFARNQRRVRYERTLAHAIQRSKSYVVGQWDEEPS